MTREKDFNMECYPYDSNRFNTWSCGIIQPKYDGDRTRMVIESGEAVLYSSSKRIITSLPHLTREFTEVYGHNEGLEIDGEIYCHEMKHPEISGIVRTTKFVPPNSYKLKFYALDLPKLNVNLVSRLLRIKATVHESSNIIHVPSFQVSNAEDIPQFLKQFCDEGYEGFVLKNPASLYETKRSVNWLKYKPRKHDVYEIVGFVEEVDKYGDSKDTLGALILKSDKGTFNVGTGFSDAERKNIWEHKYEYLHKQFRISYQELSKDGIPREPSAKIEKEML